MGRNLQRVKLRLRGSSLEDQDLKTFVAQLPGTLTSISLDLGQCEHLRKSAAVTIAALGNTNLAVDLDLAQTEARGFIRNYEEPRQNIAASLGVNLCPRPEALPRQGQRQVPAVPVLAGIVSKEKNKASERIAAARALGGLGKKALQAIDVLEQAQRLAEEESVKLAAASALAQ